MTTQNERDLILSEVLRNITESILLLMEQIPQVGREPAERLEKAARLMAKWCEMQQDKTPHKETHMQNPKNTN